jgi:Rrf2 family iron-sulfur cluster assembly transcriptional regulator
MLDLAIHYKNGAVTLSDIAGRQGISLSYLEQLFARLRRQGLVKSTRGPGGGYRLSTEPKNIRVAEIVSAINETVDATRCGGEKNCSKDSRCLTHYLWEDLSDRIHDFLNGITLGDLVNQPNVQEVACRQEEKAKQRSIASITTQ